MSKKQQYYTVKLQEQRVRRNKETPDTLYNCNILIMPLERESVYRNHTVFEVTDTYVIIRSTSKEYKDSRASYTEFNLDPKQISGHMYHFAAFSSIAKAQKYATELQKQAIKQRKTYLTQKAQYHQTQADNYNKEALIHNSQKVPTITVCENDDL